ncbi:MAG: hypothetical protein JO246_14955 [Frankiaceae bacterium]|nr:hypothetical protein [Frankiaceae bacterium]MBV9872571.1 hypothetical protein [Frankiaceae bacterium]
MAENTTNRTVEDAAITWVIAVENAAGRDATDTRGRGAAGDVSSPSLTIEVKAYGRSARGTDLWLEDRQIREAEANPEFAVYVVENVRQGDPDQFRLTVLSGDRLQRLLERKRQQTYWTVPWPVADYDADPPQTHLTL